MCPIIVCQLDAVVQSFVAQMRFVSGIRNRVYNTVTVLRATKVTLWRGAAAYRHPATCVIIVAFMPPVNPPSKCAEMKMETFLLHTFLLLLCTATQLDMSVSAMPVSTVMAMFV